MCKFYIGDIVDEEKEVFFPTFAYYMVLLSLSEYFALKFKLVWIVIIVV